MKLISIRILVTGVTLLLNLSVARSQEVTMEQALEYFNGKLGNDKNIDIIRGVLVAKFMEGSELVREDQVLLKSLDLTTMNYDATYKIFSINCKGGGKCVDREIFVNRKSTRDYSRLSFPVTLDAKSAEGMKKAFTHMTKLVVDPKYSSTEPFE